MTAVGFVPGAPSGAVVQLVHWELIGDEWVHTIEVGEFLGRTADHWLLARGQSIVRLPRAGWELCER